MVSGSVFSVRSVIFAVEAASQNSAAINTKAAKFAAVYGFSSASLLTTVHFCTIKIVKDRIFITTPVSSAAAVFSGICPVGRPSR